jgi:hypothetical protein
MYRKLLAGAGLLAALIGAADAGAAPVEFTFTGVVVDFTVPSTGVYQITADGAQGGDGGDMATGGLGALDSGDVSLTAGTELMILVGGQGASNTVNAGGGGMSAVFTSTTIPLLVAGGGGAGFNANGGPGQITTAGQAGQGTMAGAGGTNGMGGVGGAFVMDTMPQDNGGGGAGFLGNGIDGLGGVTVGSGLGGVDAAGGFTGGMGSGGGAGGLGGGGGAGTNGGGGGGGYSGGGGGSGFVMGANSDGGGGGGSFIAADFLTVIDQETGVNAGNGLVTINQISVAVPEPGSLGLLAAALAGFGLLGRRRRHG